MALIGKYFELEDLKYTIDDAKSRNNGNEYAFDINYDGDVYTLNLTRTKGTLFKGQATLPNGWSTEVSARLFEDREEGLYLFRGYKWDEEGSNFQWLVELEQGDL